MVKVFLILLGLLAASGLALAATTSRQFSLAGRAAPADASRFIVSNDFPKDKLAKVEASFVAGTIKPPDVIKLPAAYTKELGGRKQAVGVLLDCIFPPCPPSPPPSGGGNATTSTTFSDPYCPYNKDPSSEQCGGALQIEKLDHIQCTNNVSVSFYTNCNYGNYPQIEPRHPVPGCTVNSTPKCSCPSVESGPCGVVMRLAGPPPDCPLQPVSCEQCCAGSAWIYDNKTGGCSCGVGP